MPDPLSHSSRPQPNARAALLDYGLCAGTEYLFDGDRIRLERVEMDGSVDLRNKRTNSLLAVRNPDGSTSKTTVEWMRAAYATQRLAAASPLPENATERQARLLLLDADIASKKDGKVRWRHSLAWRAIADQVCNTDDACEAWLDANYGRAPGDLSFPRQSGNALRRWMRSLKKGNMKIGALVSQAGRPKNYSQLPREIDAAVDEAALYFYAAGAGVTQVMAESYMDELVDAAKAAAPPERAATFSTPSRRTLQLRIKKIECEDTWAMKYGRAAAERRFRGAGEPLQIDHVLELGFMDATQLEQIVVFDENWQIPALKTNAVFIVDGLSGAVFGWHVYAGPNRAETSAQAYLHCLEPDKFPARMVEKHPELRLCFGRFASIMPDNEKALVGPETVDGYNEAGTTIIPAPVEMPTAKASVERLIRTLKLTLQQLPGTLMDPRRASEMGFEAVEAAAEATLHQLRVIVAQVIAQHNTTESTGVDKRSPIEILASRAATRATPAFEDISPIRAALCRTFRVFVTRNGAEKDGIRYRHAPTIDRLFGNNRGRLARSGPRTNGFDMRARRNDGDIDQIEVFDEHEERWISLPSTQPAYTKGLSLWEHQQFAAAAKRRREAFGSQRARLESKAETRRVIDEMLPKSKFRKRAALAALALSEQVTSLAGKPIVIAPDVDIARQTTIDMRADDPTLPSETQKRTPRNPKHPPAPTSQPDDDDDDDGWDDATFDGDE